MKKMILILKKHWLLFVFFFVFKIILAANHAVERNLSGDEVGYLALSHSIADRFSYEVNGITHLSWGPVYPGFVAFFSFLFENPLPYVLFSQIIISFLTIIVLCLSLLEIIKNVNEDFFKEDRLLTVFVVLCVTCPFLVFYDRLLLSECTATFIFSLVVFSWVKARNQINKLSFWHCLAGVFSGVAVLNKSAFLLFPIVYMLDVFFIRKIHHRLLASLMFILCFSCTLLPWSYRNWVVSGRFIPVGVGGGLYLYLATLPVNSANVPQENEADIKQHAYINDMGEHPAAVQEKIAIDKDFRERAKERIKAEPVSYFKLSVLRVLRYWFSSHVSAVSLKLTDSFLLKFFLFSISFVLVNLAILSSFLVSKKTLIEFSPLLLMLLYFTGVHSLINSGARYSVPVWPYILILASVSFCYFEDKFNLHKTKSISS
jgi:hypothetical protein